jgi:hypothetical protein
MKYGWNEGNKPSWLALDGLDILVQTYDFLKNVYHCYSNLILTNQGPLYTISSNLYKKFVY